ncbi:hypothetical protein L208DRAFT_1173919, partial [Tricholoma matsutake]
SCLVHTSAPQRTSLQSYLDAQEEQLASTCPMCGHEQVRTTIFQHHPPFLAFQWGGESPSLNLTLQVHSHNTAVAYHLSGIIYYANQHFTAHVVNATGDSWYHDGMA